MAAAAHGGLLLHLASVASLPAEAPTSIRRTSVPHRTRLLAAGGELMVELGNFAFGVRDVVEQAQVSLRTFYQYFDTRDDFTLAIYADRNVQYAAEIRRTMPGGSRAARLRHFVYAMVSPTRWRMQYPFSEKDALHRSRALVREGLRLQEAKPEGYRAAIAPYRVLLVEIIGADGPHISVLLNSLLAEAHEVTIHEDTDTDAMAEQLFEYHRRALGLPRTRSSATGGDPTSRRSPAG
jgi:AcrR family transcriptional regulator